MADARFYFQWQNPVLRETIYPFRMRKLLDVLLYHYEIDLWKKMGKSPVDPKAAAELIGERDRLGSQLAQAKAEKDRIGPSLKALQQKHREVLNSREVRELIYKKANLQSKLSSMQALMNITKRRVEWYAQFAPEHPYYDKYRKEYELAKIPYERTLSEMKTTTDAYNAHLAAFEAEAKTLETKDSSLVSQIAQLTEKLKGLPSLDKNGNVTQREAVRWQVQKHEGELSRLEHDDLIKEVLKEFNQRSGDFPKWLQYMIVHFSGMRYQSAHASWADPRELLESLKVEEVTQSNREAAKDQIEREANLALTAQKARQSDLARSKANGVDAQAGKAIDRQISAIERRIGLLNNPYTRQRALLEVQTEEAVAEIRGLSDEQVLEAIKALKDRLPDWVWKEIAGRTPLRLDVTDLDWETLTPEQSRERWASQNQRWRSIMDAWEKKDITAWRSQHKRTLSLIVSRAVCNEIAEHIQHLRGLVPAGGLTAKPVWYLNRQKALPGKAYFKRPTSIADLKPGASILFLGWVTTRPNAWQVAPPISGVDVLPDSARSATVVRRDIVKGKGDTWRYGLDGNTYVRTSQPMITTMVNPPKVKTVKGPVIKEWLRWTHEATVAGVAEMADGNYVMTFETGQIGVNLRPLSQILNRWDIFVGYIPPSESEPANLEDMLDRAKILPSPAPSRPPAPSAMAAPPPPAVSFAVSFESPGAPAEALSGAEVIERWRTLTRRERQVVALLCQGKTTRQIATQLDTATSTINTHVSNAMHKFDLRTRVGMQAVLADWDFDSHR